MSLASKLRKNSLKGKIVDIDSFPEWYADTGNYALNMQLSGRFDGGFRERTMLGD